MKRTLQKVLRSFGYDVRQVGRGIGFVNLQDFMESRKIGLVLDVGANAGQFGKALRAGGYKGQIISFEPVREVFRRLQLDIERDPQWQAYNLALGAVGGHAIINVSKNSVLSSFLKQTDMASSFDSGARVDYEEEVEVARLDDFMGEFEVTTFLKIDTQGFERQVLDGASKSLGEIQGVQLELPIMHLYQETWHFEEAIAYMRSRGFVISQFHTMNYHSEDRVSLLEVDCIFRRIGKGEV